MVLHVGSDVLRGGGPARRAHGQPQHHRLQPIHQGLTTPQIFFFLYRSSPEVIFMAVGAFYQCYLLSAIEKS